jgi:hypothetical protein
VSGLRVLARTRSIYGATGTLIWSMGIDGPALRLEPLIWASFPRSLVYQKGRMLRDRARRVLPTRLGGVRSNPWTCKGQSRSAPENTRAPYSTRIAKPVRGLI